jgi:hypothetical protein
MELLINNFIKKLIIIHYNNHEICFIVFLLKKNYFNIYHFNYNHHQSIFIRFLIYLKILRHIHPFRKIHIPLHFCCFKNNYH